METIAEVIKAREATIQLYGFDPVTAHGFTQVPNVILKSDQLSLGAKLVYAMLLSYAWNNHYCYPGQDTLAHDMGVSKRSVVSFLKELEMVGYVEKQRRGLGRSNVYILHCQVKSKIG